MPELIKIKLGELSSFIEGNFFKSLNIRPISIIRARSYLHNPEGDSGDIVLYLLVEGYNLLAFRTLFAGVIVTNGNHRDKASSGVSPRYSGCYKEYNPDNDEPAGKEGAGLNWDPVSAALPAPETQPLVISEPNLGSFAKTGTLRLGFCSGSWVAPACRGKGYSGLLLREAYNDWQGRLVFANYSPAGLHSNMRTGLFTPLHTFSGVRSYFAFSLAVKYRHIYPSRAARSVFRIADLAINMLAGMSSFFWKPAEVRGYRFELLSRPDDECLRCAEEHKGYQLFGRGADALQWIFNYPWVSKDKGDEDILYPFSSYSPDFSLQLVKIFRNGSFGGFFTFSTRNGHLKSLHFCVSSHDFPAVADWLRNYSIQNRMAMVTVYNPAVASYLLRHRYPFLRVRPYGQKIFSTFSPEIPPGLIIQDGDGDYVFT